MNSWIRERTSCLLCGKPAAFTRPLRRSENTLSKSPAFVLRYEKCQGTRRGGRRTLKGRRSPASLRYRLHVLEGTSAGPPWPAVTEKGESTKAATAAPRKIPGNGGRIPTRRTRPARSEPAGGRRTTLRERTVAPRGCTGYSRRMPPTDSSAPPPQPTPQDIENARVRQEIAARQQAEYQECFRAALGAFGPGWTPNCRRFLIEKDEEDRV